MVQQAKIAAQREREEGILTLLIAWRMFAYDSWGYVCCVTSDNRDISAKKIKNGTW
jgi:hypothetical protein